MTDLTAIRAQMEALEGFTRGPWATECDDCHYGTLSSIRGGEAGKKSGLHRALMVEVGGWQGVKAQEATTRLIAAAPEMHATILALCDEVDAERAKNERLRGLLAEAIQWNWIDFEETNTETAEACLPSLVDLNQRIAAALAAMEDHQ